MSIDSKTNFVYFSDLLSVRHPLLFMRLSRVLKAQNVGYGLLPQTRDIWCRDYMPVQVSRDEFIQFQYDPSYLHIKKYRCTITNVDEVCRAAGIRAKCSGIVMDGGNIVRSKRRAIMTSRIFKENPGSTPQKLVGLIQRLLEVLTVIVIPEEPGDPFGHADGCVRFIDEDRVLINEPIKGTVNFHAALRRILIRHGLKILELPYFRDYDPRHEDSAVGNYINYLEVGSLVVAPSYKGYDRTNRRAVQCLRSAFGVRKKVISIEVTDLAKEGGVLNCVSLTVCKLN